VTEYQITYQSGPNTGAVDFTERLDPVIEIPLPPGYRWSTAIYLLTHRHGSRATYEWVGYGHPQRNPDQQVTS